MFCKLQQHRIVEKLADTNIFTEALLIEGTITYQIDAYIFMYIFKFATFDTMWQLIFQGFYIIKDYYLTVIPPMAKGFL